jgi:acyl-coenzyme A thioesterase PaaI-like protein
MKLPRLPKLALMGRTNGVRRAWDHCAKLPGGARVFDTLIALAIPYTGTIRPRVLSLNVGCARVALHDRRGVRNHLNSVHAIALANLAEYASNLALAYSLPDGARFIVKRLCIDYEKKARGRIVAEGRCPSVDSTQRQSVEVSCTLRDANGTDVARAVLTTLVGPVSG